MSQCFTVTLYVLNAHVGGREVNFQVYDFMVKLHGVFLFQIGNIVLGHAVICP